MKRKDFLASTGGSALLTAGLPAVAAERIVLAGPFSGNRNVCDSTRCRR